MPWTWGYAVVSVIVVSLTSFIGIVTLSSKRTDVQQVVFITVSLAVGAMFGDTFIHLLPQAFHATTARLATSLYVRWGS